MTTIAFAYGQTFSGQGHNVSKGQMDTVELTTTEAEITPFAVFGYIGAIPLGSGNSVHPTVVQRSTTVGLTPWTATNVCSFPTLSCLPKDRAPKVMSKTSFALQLDIDLTTGSDNGVYHVGPPDDRMFEQYGIVRLSTQYS